MILIIHSFYYITHLQCNSKPKYDSNLLVFLAESTELVASFHIVRVSLILLGKKISIKKTQFKIRSGNCFTESFIYYIHPKNVL